MQEPIVNVFTIAYNDCKLVVLKDVLQIVKEEGGIDAE